MARTPKERVSKTFSVYFSDGCIEHAHHCYTKREARQRFALLAAYRGVKIVKVED